MILVDTSVWVDHLSHGVPELVEALGDGLVVMHPYVRAELACGHLRERREILRLLSALPFAPVATDEEALAFIERRMLMGRGIGYFDVHLLASAALGSDVRVWTRDARLARVAGELGLRAH